MKDSSSGEQPAERRYRYTFGDTEAAAARLAVVAEVFEEPIASLLSAIDFGQIDLAVDLGCGPGYTTRLLGDVVKPQRLVGLDSSAAFLERAQARRPGNTGWYCHDVTVVPFPTGSADLLHCRWVLAHVSDPEEVLLRWLGQLRPGGRLVLHEDEQIIADHPVLVFYDQMSSSLVAHRGGDLIVGRRLKELEPPPDVRWELNRRYSHVIAGQTAARIFAMNFAVWRHDPWITDTYGREAVETMASDLAELQQSGTAAGSVTFASRQIIYRQNWTDQSNQLSPDRMARP
jgi:trans-aconitate 2-methyltransferase